MTIDELADKPPGYDDGNPYGGVDIRELPDWWRRNIQEHNEKDLRPFRPSRFKDGPYTFAVVRCLEDRYQVNIDLIIKEPQSQENIECVIVVEGELVGTMQYARIGDGFTKYNLDSEEFCNLVRSATK